MNLAMISCKQAALLTSKKSMDSLSSIEKWKLNMHLKVCTACDGFAKQSELLDQAIETLGNQKKETLITLTDEQRAKILKVLN
jgi:hypothetical protein